MEHREEKIASLKAATSLIDKIDKLSEVIKKEKKALEKKEAQLETLYKELEEKLSQEKREHA